MTKVCTYVYKIVRPTNLHKVTAVLDKEVEILKIYKNSLLNIDEASLFHFTKNPKKANATLLVEHVLIIHYIPRRSFLQTPAKRRTVKIY